MPDLDELRRRAEKGANYLWAMELDGKMESVEYKRLFVAWQDLLWRYAQADPGFQMEQQSLF